METAFISFIVLGKENETLDSGFLKVLHVQFSIGSVLLSQLS